jgi:hypothetical protein
MIPSPTDPFCGTQSLRLPNRDGGHSRLVSYLFSWDRSCPWPMVIPVQSSPGSCSRLLAFIIQIVKEALCFSKFSIILIVCTCELTYEIVFCLDNKNSGNYRHFFNGNQRRGPIIQHFSMRTHEVDQSCGCTAITILTSASICDDVDKLQSEFMYRYVCVNQSEFVH